MCGLIISNCKVSQRIIKYTYSSMYQAFFLLLHIRAGGMVEAYKPTEVRYVSRYIEPKVMLSLIIPSLLSLSRQPLGPV